MRLDSTDPTAQTLMNALSVEDRNLEEARKQLDHARTAFQLATRKFAAVRDLVRLEFGANPYSRMVSGFDVSLPSGGRYRYLQMNPGDAIIDVLKEAGEPLTLEEIVAELEEGGLSHFALTRIVNAAVMRTSGVQKTEDGKYRFEQDIEEVPFE